MKFQDNMFKIVLFGDGGVGKTTLINRYLTGTFSKNSQITIGVDFHVKRVNINGKSVSLQIWDFAGEERFRFLLPSYALGASGGIFLYDITRYSSIKNFDSWLEIFKQGYRGNKHKIPVLLVGSKMDLEFKRAVSRAEAFDLAKNNNLYGYLECSAKNGRNIDDIFNQITRLMLRRAKRI